MNVPMRWLSRRDKGISRWQVRVSGSSHRFAFMQESAPVGAAEMFVPVADLPRPCRGAARLDWRDPVVALADSLHHRLISGNPPGPFARGGAGAMSDALPAGWLPARIEHVIEDFQPGFASGEKNVEGGVAHLRMNNIGLDGELVLDLVRTVPEKLAKSRHDLRRGDVLVCTTNSGEARRQVRILRSAGTLCLQQSPHAPSAKRWARGWPLSSLELWLQWKSGAFDDQCKHWVNQSTLPKDALLESECRFLRSPSSGGLWRSWRRCWAKWTPASSGWRRFPSCSNASANPSSPPPAPAASPPIGGRRIRWKKTL